MAQPLIKFFRVAELPTGAGVPGALYFVHDSNLGEGKGKLYICTATGVFEDYTGLHSYENTTYDLQSVVNELKGQIQLVGSDKSVDNLYIEGGANIKVSSTAEGVKVEHTTPTTGTELSANETVKDPGYGQTFTAVTGLTKDDNGHIVAATLEEIKMPGEQDLSNYKTKQEAVADVAASGTASTVVTSVTQNANGEITVTKANLPTESADVDSLDGKNGVITTLKGQTATGSINLEVDANNQLKATLVGSFENGAQVNKLEGVKLNGTALTIAEDKTVNVTAIEGIAENDKILSKNGNNIMSTLSMSYDSDAKKIYLKGIGSATISEINAADFIKDGMVDKASIVWCTIDAEGKHVPHETEVENSIRCLQIIFNTDAGKEPIHIPLNELTDVYTGAVGEITVSEANVIGLADVTPNNNLNVKQDLNHSTATDPDTFAAVTGVTVDLKGRVTGVEKTTFTMPKIDIEEHVETGSDDYVNVTVTTENGGVKDVSVNTDTLTTKISGIEADLTEAAQVTAAALVDLDSRLGDLEGGTIKSVTGETAELNNTAYVNVKATTTEGAVTLESAVQAVEATDPKYTSTGLATDGYVNEKVATVAATAGTAVQKIESKEATIQVTREEKSNDVNLELVWAAF